MSPLVRVFLLLGVVFLMIAGVIYLVERLGIQVGRLPGDIRIQRGNLTCFFPLATTILLSIVLTVLLNLIIRLLKK
jgi:Protein of unknown function (DUF2905)